MKRNTTMKFKWENASHAQCNELPTPTPELLAPCTYRMGVGVEKNIILTQKFSSNAVLLACAIFFH